MSGISIERYFNEKCLIPALKAIGHSKQMMAREGLIAHFEDYYEVHLILDGTVNWWVEDEKYTLQPGSVFVTKPGEVHGSSQEILEPCTLNWLQVDPSYLADKSVEAALRDLPTRHWNGANELFTDIDLMLAEIRHPKPDSARMLNALLGLFIAKLLRQQKNPSALPILPQKFANLLVEIEALVEADQLISMEALGEMSGLSRSRLFQLFEQYIGQSPISYVRNLRIKRAQTLLQQPDIQITTIGTQLGFSSSQHFATAFKRITGMTPRAYRKLRPSIPDASSVTSTKGHIE